MEAQVEARLDAYVSNMNGVLPQFAKVARSVDGTLGQDDLLEAILPLVTAAPPTRAPKGCPRVLLLGGPGSKAEEIGKAMAARYGVIFVSARELLHAASLKPDRIG